MRYEEKRANVAEVKEHLSAYITAAEKGEKVIVCKRNRPVAEIVPIQARTQETNKTKLGSDIGSVTVNCDLTEPAMDEEDWEMLK